MTSGIPELPGLADLSPLGQGGLADVYLARQVHLERWVAAKVFRVSLDDEQAADRFRAECRALGRLDQYPNIITVYDAGVLADGRPYLISERCDGSLADLVAVRGPLSPDRVGELGLTLARALRYAHSAGVLHGDVTPQNVLLRASGAPVLADFGLAVLRENATATAAGFTQAHAAPETLGDTRAIDERSDVYGLGSTLHAALTGQAPFPREPGEDDPEHVDRIRTEPVPEPAGPPALTGLVVAMLAKDPARRPGTDEITDRLGSLADGVATQAMRLPGGPAAAWGDPGDAVTRAAGPVERTRLQEGPRRTPAAVPGPRRRRRGVVLGTLAALLVLAGGAAAFWQASRPAPAAAPTAPTTTPARPVPAPVTSAPRTSTSATTETGPSTSARTRTPGPTAPRAPRTPDRVRPPSSAPAPPAPSRPGPSSSPTPAPRSSSGTTEPTGPGADSGAGRRGPSGTGDGTSSPEAGTRDAPAAVAPATASPTTVAPATATASGSGTGPALAG